MFECKSSCGKDRGVREVERLRIDEIHMSRKISVYAANDIT